MIRVGIAVIAINSIFCAQAVEKKFPYPINYAAQIVDYYQNECFPTLFITASVLGYIKNNIENSIIVSEQTVIATRFKKPKGEDCFTTLHIQGSQRERHWGDTAKSEFDQLHSLLVRDIAQEHAQVHQALQNCTARNANVSKRNHNSNRRHR